MKNMKNKLLRTALSLVTACLLVLAILPQVRQESGASSAEPAQSGAVPTVQTEPVETKPEAPRFIVCIDPGHGGNDSGCGRSHKISLEKISRKEAKKRRQNRRESLRCCPRRLRQARALPK